MSQAAYRILVNGTDVSANFGPVLISLEITDGEGGKADTLDIELDDAGGQIVLPAAGATIEASLWWNDPPDGTPAGSITFTGKTDEPKSTGSRKEGMKVSISAKSADMGGKGKHKTEKHQDNATFGVVSQQWGSAAGYNVTVDPTLAAINRDWWHMANESFLSWGRRIANELGATFKVSFPNAAFVPVNSGAAASGASLSGVTAAWGVNLISWDLTPVQSRATYNNSKVRWYDPAAAVWNVVSTAIGDPAASADLTETFKHADVGRANSRAAANASSAKGGQGSGHVEIDGNPAAMAQANLTVSGTRDGIDGQYRIKEAKHKYIRESGWTTTCELKQPQGSAGTDSR